MELSEVETTWQSVSGMWNLNKVELHICDYVYVQGVSTRSYIYLCEHPTGLSVAAEFKERLRRGLTAEGDRQCAQSSFIFLTTLNHVNLHVCVYLQCFTYANCGDFAQFAWSSPTFKPKRSQVFWGFFYARCPEGELKPAEYKGTEFSWPGGTVN